MLLIQLSKFEAGTLLYVRVVNANIGMNPELSCMDANGKAAEYGILKEGYMFETSTGLSRMLLSSPPHPVLEGLGKKLSFEIAVGINGRFWENASQASMVILVGNAIQKSESLSLVQQKIYLDKCSRAFNDQVTIKLSCPHILSCCEQFSYRSNAIINVFFSFHATHFLFNLKKLK